MSCLDTISKLREQQDKTVQLYQSLYESFISTPASRHHDDSTLDYSKYNDTLDYSKYNDTRQNVTDMITEQSLDSTCDVPRLESQNTTISEMWRNFSVDKYAPRAEDKRKLAQSAPPVKKSKPRRPRITVPDPFYMTLREELKKPVKTKAQEEAELRKIEQELEEETECRKQFKASPIPHSTYGSRLSSLTQKQEARRSRVKEQRKMLTKALQQPFTFDNRQSLRRSRSLSALDSQEKKSKENPKFNARPMPHHIFDPEVDEKAREEEAYRQIRIKMRAEQLLAESELPSTMKRHALHYTDGHIRRRIQQEKERFAGLTEEHTFTPAIKDYIPHYTLLHHQQEEELLQRQSEKPTTQCEPFNLQTEKLAQMRALNPRTSPVQSTLQPTFRKSPCLYTAVYPDHNSSPVKATVGSSLRDSATRNKILAEKKKIQHKYESELVTKMKEVELRRDITEKSKALDPSNRKKDEVQIKLKQKIEEQKRKELEYKAQLDHMKEKLKERPFLFERASTDIARQSADKTFRKVLLEAGIDPALVDDLSKFEEDSLMVS